VEVFLQANGLKLQRDPIEPERGDNIPHCLRQKLNRHLKCF